ncbi:hypothetical protein AAMO2058_001206400 [Amorphochlora amoebiformis]
MELGALPVGRLEVLSWINSFLNSDYTKIEHLGDGIAYCKIFAKLFPKKVSTKRLVLKPKYKDQNIRNLRYLEDVLRRCNIKKDVHVKKIANGKFQDNYEFATWCIQYIHKNPKLLQKAVTAKSRQITEIVDNSNVDFSMAETVGIQGDFGTEGIQGGYEMHKPFSLPPRGTPGTSPIIPKDLNLRRNRPNRNNILDRKDKTEWPEPIPEDEEETDFENVMELRGRGTLPPYYATKREERSKASKALDAPIRELENMLRIAETDLQSRIRDQSQTLARIQELKAGRDSLFGTLVEIEQMLSSSVSSEFVDGLKDILESSEGPLGLFPTPPKSSQNSPRHTKLSPLPLFGTPSPPRHAIKLPQEGPSPSPSEAITPKIARRRYTALQKSSFPQRNSPDNLWDPGYRSPHVRKRVSPLDDTLELKNRSPVLTLIQTLTLILTIIKTNPNLTLLCLQA